MDSPDNLAQQFEGKGWYDFSAGGREHEEELIPLDVRKVNALSFLYG